MDRAVSDTRIRRDYLIAIEGDDFTFQAPAYVRALVANYARYLRLDPAPLLVRLDEVVAADDGVRALVQKNETWAGVVVVPSARRPLIVTAVALVLVTSLTLWNKANARDDVSSRRRPVEVSEQDVRPRREP